MTKFVPRLIVTMSVASPTTTAATNRNDIVVTFLLVAAAVGCTLPWMQSTGASLTANVSDLAEWLSLHPTVRATSTILLPALLLRITLAVIAALAVLQANTRCYTVAPLVLALVLWLGLLPPVAFFQGNFMDANYLQQAVLWGITTLGMVILWRLPARLQRVAQMVLIILGIIGALWGLWIALDLMGRYEIPARMGWGVVVFVMALVGYVGMLWWEARSR